MTPNRNTPVSEVIKDLPPTTVKVHELARGRAIYPDLWPKLLLACEGDQMLFLAHLWDRVAHTEESALVWLSLIKAGFFVAVLDPSNKDARDLVRAVAYPIERMKEYYDNAGKECSCRRVRR